MRVSDLAKEFNTTTDAVLAKLKSLKLKAKDAKQELNAVVLSVLRNEFKKDPKGSAKVSTLKEEVPVKKESPRKAVVEDKKVKEKIKAEKKRPTTKVKEKSKEESVKKGVEKTPKIKPQEKIKKKISSAPFVAVKPLVKKKRKIRGEGHQEAHGFETKISDTPVAERQIGQAQEIKEDKAVAHKADADIEVPPPVDEDPRLPTLEIKVPIAVKDLAVKLQQKTNLVLKKLLQLGIFANINQGLDEDIIRKISKEFGFNITKVKTEEEQVLKEHKQEEEDPKELKSRAPVVTLMGHVDHGKTTLLDKIRNSSVADQEHGGITQHIGAYSVKVPKGMITFLDTPGHEAFTAMRARGAHITDLVILVVAADEGVMPQTDEAIDHAKAANVPIVVAATKIDKPNIDLDRLKKQLSERELLAEDWGGKTIVVGVSAVTGKGVEALLESILLEAELLELKANYQKKASGIVVEAHLSRGKGVIATLIIQSGTLKEGDIVVVGPYYGKVKAMFDDRERTIKEAGPSVPVEVLGLPDIPEAGNRFYIVNDEKQAKEITQRRQEQIKTEKLHAVQKLTLEGLYAQIKEGNIKELNIILKADVQGSLEALVDSLQKIQSEEVKMKFIHTGIGDVNYSDVILAVASSAIIICFNVGIGPKAEKELEHQPVDVRQYRIIYDAVNDVKKAVEGLLAPKLRKKFLGRVEVREIFKLSKSGLVAGCYVSKGKVHRKVQIDVQRNGQVVFSGTLSSLKRFKDDVREVTEGFECGITLDGFSELQAGDVIEAYEIEQIARTL